MKEMLDSHKLYSHINHHQALSNLVKSNKLEDAYALVSQLTDPNIGNLKSNENNTLKQGLLKWLDYYSKNNYNYLLPILQTALSLYNNSTKLSF